MMNRRTWIAGITVTSLLAALLTACKQEQREQEMRQTLPVMVVSSRAVEFQESYSASIRGRQDVEIRPNVSGFITKLSVDEGAVVRKGQTLFIIDPVQYEEAVNVARAAVNVAESAVATAQLTVDNKRELAKKNIISNYDLQMAENTLASQQATLAQARAQLVNAEKNLSYTQVTSPSDGVVGTIPFRVGALVSPSMTTPLTTVSDISEMYVYFSMTEKQLLDLIRQDGSSNGILEKMPMVGLALADGSLYPERGKIETISGVIDQNTGTVSLRAAFPNEEQSLNSGGSGNVIIPVTYDNCVVIPQAATFEIQDRVFVFKVVDGKTQSAPVEVTRVNGGQEYIVNAGLNSGDVIVAEGVGLLREGTPIEVKQN